MQQKMDAIKNAIATATQLVHYDPNELLVIEMDASQKGIGLTSTEANYSTISREKC